MEPEKLEGVGMGLEEERDGGRGFLEDLPGEGMECTRGRAQQRDGRIEVVESGLRKGDVAPWVQTPVDGEDG